MALDPRFKSLRSIDESQHESIKNHLVTEMVKARKQKYSLNLVEKVKVPVITTATETTKKRRNMREDRSNQGIYARYVKIHKAATDSTTAGTAVVGFNTAEVTLDCRQEFERFVSSTGLDMVKESNESELEDPLPWWAAKKSLFPNVWTLAKYYLGIPATSANSERCFSFSNRLLCASRTQMNAKVAEDTFFVHRNFDLLPQSPTKSNKKRKLSSSLDDDTIVID